LQTLHVDYYFVRYSQLHRDLSVATQGNLTDVIIYTS
jgi:hypothetical protein